MEGTTKGVLYFLVAAVVILAITSETTGNLHKEISWADLAGDRSRRSIDDQDKEMEGPDAVDLHPYVIVPITYRRYVFGLKGPPEDSMNGDATGMSSAQGRKGGGASIRPDTKPLGMGWGKDKGGGNGWDSAQAQPRNDGMGWGMGSSDGSQSSGGGWDKGNEEEAVGARKVKKTHQKWRGDRPNAG